MTYLYFSSMLLLSVFALHRLYLTWVMLRRPSPCTETTALAQDFPHVTVQLPLYNEPHVVQRLLAACASLDWPAEKLHIQILDDSTDCSSTLITQFLQQSSIRHCFAHIRRASRQGYKAGALKEGLKIAQGDFIAIFDADFCPQVDFLKKTISFLQHHPRVGMVQARWSFLNAKHSVLTFAQSIFLNAHFDVEHRARQALSCFLNFNGTAGVWRKQAILDAGNWSDDTLTEDLDLSYRAQLCGWRFAYLPNVHVPSELPQSLQSLKSQQYRWAKGSAQSLVKLLPQLWRAPLPRRVKREALWHLLSNWGYLFFLAMVLSFGPYYNNHAVPAPNLAALSHALWLICFASMLTFFTAGHAGIGLGYRIKVSLIAIGLGLSLAVNNTWATLSGLWQKRGEFVRTPKLGDQNNSQRLELPPSHFFISLSELVLLAFFATSLLKLYRAEHWWGLVLLGLISLCFAAQCLLSLWEALIKQTPSKVA